MNIKILSLIFIFVIIQLNANGQTRRKDSNLGLSFPLSYTLSDSKASSEFNVDKVDGFIFQATTNFGVGASIGFVTPQIVNKQTNESFLVNTNFVELYYDFPIHKYVIVMGGYGIGEYQAACNNSTCKANYGEEELDTAINTFNIFYIKLGGYVWHQFYLTLSQRVISAEDTTVTSLLNNGKSFEINLSSSLTDFGFTAYF